MTPLRRVEVRSNRGQSMVDRGKLRSNCGQTVVKLWSNNKVRQVVEGVGHSGSELYYVLAAECLRLRLVGYRAYRLLPVVKGYLSAAQPQ